MSNTVITPTLLPLPTSIFTIKTIQSEDGKENIIEIDNIEGARKMHVRRHKVGLYIKLMPRYDYEYNAVDDLQIIPGQYTIEKVANHIATRAGIPNLRKGDSMPIAEAHLIDQLQSSLIWEKRGKLNWKDVPADFWNVVEIPDFIFGTIKSYSAWWISSLLKYDNGKNKIRQNNKWKLKSDVEASLAEGTLPEHINRIRHWNKLSFSELMNFVGSGYTMSPQWANFVMNVKETFYAEVMEKHNDWLTSEIFPSAVEYLNRLPKNEKVINALNALINSGLSATEVIELNLITVKDIEKAANYSKSYQVISRQNKKHLNSNYKPPTLDDSVFDSEKFQWADHLTFPALSDLYSCCISNYGSYESRIVDGLAHTIFAKDHSPDNNGGILAYISYQDKDGNRYYTNPEELSNQGTWKVQESRSYANNNPSAENKAAIERIVVELNKQYPGKATPIPQMTKEALLSEMATDVIGQRVRDIWLKK